jgi:hypothetical protein
MNVVFAVSTASVATQTRGQVLVRMGSHWPADDPLVLAHPGLFTADPQPGLSYSERPAELDDAPVESATAAPGEKRAAVRRG